LSKKRNDIDIALNSDVNALSGTSYGIIDFFVSIVMAFSILIYMASISISLFLATVITSVLGVFLYSKSQKKVSASFAEAIELESVYMRKANALLDGFKEIFMDRGKGKDIFDRDLHSVSERSKSVNLRAQTSMMNGQVAVQMLFYLLITFVLLMATRIESLSAGEIVKYIFTLLFLVGSISTIVTQLSSLARATASYKHLTQICEDLENEQRSSYFSSDHSGLDTFIFLKMKDIEFLYEQSSDRFRIGSFDFSISRGEVVFIYGGNGSGKTTFINLLMGVYDLKTGQILYNDEIVKSRSLEKYRMNFSFVASDYYLFDELYGINEVDLEMWNYYLVLFELEGLLTLEGKKLSTVNLSTGQRKRLALIVALQEKKPILVLDEWAADQDPLFRKKFYLEILPFLKTKGFTIIAITHDDRYYYCADRLLHMEEGLLKNEDLKLFQNKVLL
jgi:putative ATP-binding cassette transporter